MDSDEGKVIARAKIGIVLHIEYDIYFDDQGVPRFTTKRFGVDVSNIKTSPDVYLKDAYFDSNAGRVTLTDDETNAVINSINSAQSHLGTIDFEAIPSQLLAELNVYKDEEQIQRLLARAYRLRGNPKESKNIIEKIFCK